MKELIVSVAGRYGLPPALVESIVQAESAGNPAAVRYEPRVGNFVQDPTKHKPRGCSVETERRLQMMSFGLMQVMGFNIRAMGFTGWLTEYLDPAKGLEVGCRFLAGLLKKWPKVEDAVSAYNQGGPRKGPDGRYTNQAYVSHVMAAYDAEPVGVSPYRFSKLSLAKLRTCDEKLQRLMGAALTSPACPMDFTILEGHRGQAEQDAAFRRGASKVKWPNGQHNTSPSRAVDVAPYPVDRNDVGRFARLADHIKSVAADLGIEVEWGGDWVSFKDYPHWQLP